MRTVRIATYMHTKLEPIMLLKLPVMHSIILPIMRWQIILH